MICCDSSGKVQIWSKQLKLSGHVRSAFCGRFSVSHHWDSSSKFRLHRISCEKKNIASLNKKVLIAIIYQSILTASKMFLSPFSIGNTSTHSGAQVSEGIGGNGRSGGVSWPLATLGSAVAKHGSSSVAKERIMWRFEAPLRGIRGIKPEKYPWTKKQKWCGN